MVQFMSLEGNKMINRGTNLEGLSIADADIKSLVYLINEKGRLHADNLLRKYAILRDNNTTNNILEAIRLLRLKNVNSFKIEVVNGTYQSYLDNMTSEGRDELIKDFIYVLTQMDMEGKYDYYYALLSIYVKENAKLTMQTKKED